MKAKTGFKKSLSGKIFDILNTVFMALFCISILFPFWDMIVLSFTSADKVNTLSIKLWPEKWVFDSYKYILSDSKMLNALLVSVYRTIAGTIIHVVMIVLAAYPLSKKDLPYRKPIMIYFLIPLYFSGV